MKTNKGSLKASMDRRLSFLDDVPSCRAAVQYRIAQEEEPVMKKKISVGFVFAMVLALLSAAALAATLLLSPRAAASRTADQALAKERGITAEMQTFFGRQEEELADGTVKVSYTGVGSLEDVLGTYTVLVKDGSAKISWSHDGEETSGGYNAEAWGLEQLQQMMTDCLDEKSKDAYLLRAEQIAAAHGSPEDEDTEPSEPIENYMETLEASKTAALKARKISEEQMLETAREFIISSYGLNEEQTARMELYTDLGEEAGNGWYDMVNGKPCWVVEYLLYQPDVPEQEGVTVTPLPRDEKDGYYKVCVNVETGVIESYEYNSGLGGKG